VCWPLGHSFAYVAHFVFLTDVWIRTKRAADLATRNIVSSIYFDLILLRTLLSYRYLCKWLDRIIVSNISFDLIPVLRITPVLYRCF
jgi:hypothetical protein